MNSLEFIKENIEYLERQITYFKNRLNSNFNGPQNPLDLYHGYTEDDLKNKLKNLKNTNKHLQQIKTILEAWYEIKNLYLKGYFSRVALPIESDRKFKKALEVKDEL